MPWVCLPSPCGGLQGFGRTGCTPPPSPCANPPPSPLKVRKTTVRWAPVLSHNPAMAVTPGIPSAGNHCPQVQQTRQSRAHESSKRGRAAATSTARRQSRHHVYVHFSCHCVPPLVSHEVFERSPQPHPWAASLSTFGCSAPLINPCPSISCPPTHLSFSEFLSLTYNPQLTDSTSVLDDSTPNKNSELDDTELPPEMLALCVEGLDSDDDTYDLIGQSPNSTHTGSLCRRLLSCGCSFLPSSAKVSASLFPRTFIWEGVHTIFTCEPAACHKSQISFQRSL